MSRRIPVLALALGLFAAAVAMAQPHGFNATDLQSMERVLAPAPSPSGDWIAFMLRTSDLKANRGHTDIWLVGRDGKGLRRLTTDGASSDAHWAPDGKTLYFLSAAGETSQLWCARRGADGAFGAPERLLALPLDISNPLPSPDGTHIAFSLEVFVDCANLACTKSRRDQRAASSVKARLYPDAVGFVRHWDTWNDGSRNHLFVARLEALASEPIDLTRGMNSDVPSKPFGGSEEWAFSPDGRQLVFAARQGGRDEPLSTHFALYEAPVDGSAAPRELTVGHAAWNTYPAFSPDGKWLAYAMTTRPGFESDRFHIVLRELASGKERMLAEDWDRSTGPLAFSHDGGTLLTSAADTGQTLPFAIDVATGVVRKLAADGHAENPLPAGDRVVFSGDNLRSPAELYTVGLDGTGLTQITHINQQRLEQVSFGEPEQFHFRGAGGQTVYGWVVKPANYVAGRRYPVAFLIHGGPQGTFDNHFHYRWNPEVYAGAGYGVVEIDFHGSTGYGQAFTDSISGDWGGKPLQDLQLGLAAVLNQYSWLDGDRVCALGASYGGFMTNWIAGAWPDRFRCLVTHDGVFDQRMMYYGTEELWFEEWENGHLPYFTKPANYERFNPVNQVEKWKTPMLIVQGALDYRIADTQGIGAFAALQRRKVPSEFLFFPNENHWVVRPADSVLWHDVVLDWLGHWLRNEQLRSPGSVVSAAP